MARANDGGFDDPVVLYSLGAAALADASNESGLTRKPGRPHHPLAAESSSDDLALRACGLADGRDTKKTRSPAHQVNGTRRIHDGKRILGATLSRRLCDSSILPINAWMVTSLRTERRGPLNAGGFVC